MTQS
jgi:hypothetical protein